MLMKREEFVLNVKVIIYVVGIIFLILAAFKSIKASEPQVFWPPDMVPHPHIPHPKPNPNDNQADK